jgi:integrase/recombinase XerD
MTDQTEEYYKYLSKIKGLSDRTIYHYMTYHRHFKDQEITQKSINKFLQSKSNNTVCRSYLKSWLEFLGKEKEFDIPKAKTGRDKQRIIRHITRSEMKKIIHNAYLYKTKFGIMFEILYYGALRRSELGTIKTNSINWSKMDGENVEVKVIGKGKKDRTIYIPTKTAFRIVKIYFKKGLINNHMNREDIVTKLSSMDDRLFTYSENRIWRKIKDLSIKALGRAIRPHEIRHARATHMLEDKIPERTIQRYLGHSSLAVTEIYLHTTEKKALEEIDLLSKHL